MTFDSHHAYLYSSMQSSFILFYLFRLPQRNLLTSKGEIKYRGSSFSEQPKSSTLSSAFSTAPMSIFFSLFQQLMRVLYLFIYLVNYISPSGTIQNRVHKFPGAYHKTRQDFAHILLNFPSPASKYPLRHNGLASY